MRSIRSTRLLLLFSLLLLVACSGPEAKKQKFLAKGQTLFDKGDYVKARIELKNAVQIDPKFAEALRLSGLIDMKEGNLKAAYGTFAKVIQLNPSDKVAQYQTGKILLAVRQLDKAMEQAELLLKLDPNYPEALLLKGAVLVARNDHLAARPFLEGVIARGVRQPDGYLLLANANLLAHDDKGTEEALRRGLEANPNSVDLHLALVGLCSRNGRKDEVARLLVKVCALELDNFRHSLNLAAFYWSDGKQAQALELLGKVVAADPSSEERRLKVTKFYLSHERIPDAERELKDGIAKNPKNFPLRLALAELYLKSGRAELGIASLKETAGSGKESDPGVVQTKTALAQVYLQRGELAQAAGYVEEVLKESPKNVEVRFVKGNILLEKQDGLNAVNEFRTVVSEKPQFIAGYIRLAQAYLLKKDNGLALDTLKSALKLDPSSREAQIALARYYGSQRDFKTAQEVLAKLLVKTPGDLESRVEQGDLYAASGEQGKAQAEYARVKSMAPGLPIGYVKLGAWYLRQGKRGQAIAEYEKAYQLNQKSWLLANDLAFLIAESSTSPKELDRALAMAEQARTLNPEAVNVLDTLGWLHFRKGEAKKAVELLRQVQSKRPEAPEANFHLGMALYQAGQLQEAKQMLSKSLSGKGSFAGRDEASRTLAKI